MGRRHYVPMGRHHDIPIRRREDVPLRRLGDVPLRRRWVFHLRRTYNVAGTYRETSLRRRHHVLLLGDLKGSTSRFFNFSAQSQILQGSSNGPDLP